MTRQVKKLWPVSCPLCGAGKIRIVRGEGRHAKHRNVELPVPASMGIPTCTNCGSEWIDAVTARQLDAVMQRVYEDHLKAEALRLLQELAQQAVPQNRVERLLGLSQGYLSKVRSGASRPSAMLVACLRLLSRDTDERLAEIDADRPATKATRRSRRKKPVRAAS